MLLARCAYCQQNIQVQVQLALSVSVSIIIGKPVIAASRNPQYTLYLVTIKIVRMPRQKPWYPNLSTQQNISTIASSSKAGTCKL
jgi:hypothetical protein